MAPTMVYPIPDRISSRCSILDRIYYGRLFIGSKNKLVQRVIVNMFDQWDQFYQISCSGDYSIEHDYANNLSYDSETTVRSSVHVSPKSMYDLRVNNVRITKQNSTIKIMYHPRLTLCVGCRKERQWRIQGAPPARPPNGTRFFCFRIHFCQKHEKVFVSEVGAPFPHPSGKSWIRS